MPTDNSPAAEHNQPIIANMPDLLGAEALTAAMGLPAGAGATVSPEPAIPNGPPPIARTTASASSASNLSDSFQMEKDGERLVMTLQGAVAAIVAARAVKTGDGNADLSNNPYGLLVSVEHNPKDASGDLGGDGDKVMTKGENEDKEQPNSSNGVDLQLAAVLVAQCAKEAAAAETEALNAEKAKKAAESKKQKEAEEAIIAKARVEVAAAAEEAKIAAKAAKQEAEAAAARRRALQERLQQANQSANISRVREFSITDWAQKNKKQP